MTSSRTTLGPRSLRRADLRFGGRLAAAGAAFAVAAVPAALLLVLVEAHWGPLHTVDQQAALRLHTVVRARPELLAVVRLLSDLVWAPLTFRLLVAFTVAGLLARRAWRLALWAAATETAAGLIGLLLKVSVARVRPHLPYPVATAPGYSFPSGHAMTAAASCAILLLVLLPAVQRRLRPVAWCSAVVSVVGVGLTRVALGVHWVSDVLGGWLLGLALVAATAWAFEAWRGEIGRPAAPVTEGLEPEVAEPAGRAPEPPLGAGARTAPRAGTGSGPQ
jgi:undecaprenyl-diphosphatase